MPFWAASRPAATSLDLLGTKQQQCAPAPACGLLSFRRRRSRARPLLGIDIGTAAIKLVELRRRGAKLVLNKIALASTPPAAVTNGALTDSIAVSETLRKIFRTSRIHHSQAALSVGGEKSRAQCEVLPAEAAESAEALRAYVDRTASSQVSFSLELAAVDYQTVLAPNGEPGTVCWASSGAAEVDWARQAAALAGSSPVVVEPRACSLVNAYQFNHEPEAGSVALLLHAGARWLVIALVRDGLLLYSRDVPLPEPGASVDPPDAAAILGALRPRLHEITRRSAPARIERLVLSGSARVEREGQEIGRETGLPVEQMEPFRRIGHSLSETQSELIREWGPLFSIAAGLALRGFEEL